MSNMHVALTILTNSKFLYRIRIYFLLFLFFFYLKVSVMVTRSAGQPVPAAGRAAWPS